MEAPLHDEGEVPQQTSTYVSGLRRYKVLFEIPHCFYSIERPYSDKIGGFRGMYADTSEPVIVDLIDMRQEIGGASVHTGIAATVEVSGVNIQQAISLAAQRLDAVLKFGALQSNAAVGVPRLVLAIERTAGSATTEMVQVEENLDDVFTKKRGLDLPAVERIGRAFDQHGNARIARALHWYRKALNEDDPIDQFTSFWVGLEALDGPLKVFLGENPETRSCKTCGTPYEVPTNKGIRALFSAHSSNGIADFKLCRNLRVDIQHSTSDLVVVFQKSPAAAEAARSMLRMAIYLLLGLPAAEAVQAGTTIYNNQGLRAEYYVRYATSPDAFAEPPILDTEDSTITVTQDGEHRHVMWNPSVRWHTTVTIDALGLFAKTQAGTWQVVPPANVEAPNHEEMQQANNGGDDE